jgi:protein-S-isoprenylcysteine O-methyltransferase Ste14
MNRSKGPGVPFPPPFIFVAGFVTGLLLQRVWPLPLVPGGRASLLLPLAWTMVALGLGLTAWALTLFWRARTSVMPNQPASILVLAGPYRFSRNPMYAGLIVTYLGLALWRDALWPVVLLPLVLFLLWWAVIRKEELHLAEAFGRDYAEYCRRVRRWI